MKKAITSALERTYQPVDTRPIYEWANEHITLPSGKFSEKGQFDIEHMPYAKEIFDALQGDAETVILLKAIKHGGTMISDMTVPWLLVNHPGNILYVFNTNQIAKDHMASRIRPILMSSKSKVLKDTLPKFARNITDEGFDLPNALFRVSGNSEDRLQSKSSRYVFCSECWRWDHGALDWADNRRMEFKQRGSSKLFAESQGGLMYSDDRQETDWSIAYRMGTMKEFEVPCLKCNKLIPQDFTNLKFDKLTGDDGEYLFNKMAPTIRLVCPHCKHEHKDEKEFKEHAKRNYQWRQTNPNPLPRHESFRLSGLFTQVYQWRDMMIWFLQAKEEFNRTGVPTKITEFNQSRMAINVDTDKLYDMRDQMKFYDYNLDSEWNEAVARFSILDVSGGENNENPFFWQLIIEFSRKGDSRLLWFGKQETDDDITKKHIEHNIQPHQVFVDIGWRMNTYSALYAASHKYFGVRGSYSGLKHFIWTDEKSKARYTEYFSNWQHVPAGNSGLVCHYTYFDVDRIKDMLDGIRKGKTPIKMHRPLDNSVYIEQMDSERPQWTTQNGKQNHRWIRKGNRDNHAWDLETYALGVALMYKSVKGQQRIEIENSLFPSMIDSDVSTSGISIENSD